MRARSEVDVTPEEFQQALIQFRSARLRPEVAVEEMSAPQRIAPFSAALTADVTIDHRAIGGGRLVLLYDPKGNDAWNGVFRCVAYARADIDPEMMTDPMLGGVGWSWLEDALRAHEAGFDVPSGTVTKLASEKFGGMADEPTEAEIEVRASWSPLGSLTAHVQAWGDLLCTACGLPPVPDGVVTLSKRRGPRQ